ncbi:uncharacterized protein [Periplaneta americana]|uniref:uncharacterized protein n=1 Tax=Periplaneta americana TaxID=6978 RepID=UPI0037E74C42
MTAPIPATPMPAPSSEKEKEDDDEEDSMSIGLPSFAQEEDKEQEDDEEGNRRRGCWSCLKYVFCGCFRRLFGTSRKNPDQRKGGQMETSSSHDRDPRTPSLITLWSGADPSLEIQFVDYEAEEELRAEKKKMKKCSIFRNLFCCLRRKRSKL